MEGYRFKTPRKKRRGVEVYHESIKQNMSTRREFTGAYGEDAEQPYIRADWVCKTGGGKTESRVQSFCGEAANMSCVIASSRRAMKLLSAFNLGDNGLLA